MIAETRTRSDVAPARQRKIHPVLVARLAGSQAQMGQQHAEILRETGGYEGAFDFYQHLASLILTSGFPLPLRGARLEGVVRRVVQAASRRMERSRTAEERERSRLFFSALGAPDARSLDLLSMDAMQNLASLGMRLEELGGKGLWRGHPVAACSSAMAWGAATSDGRLLHARNFDLPGAGVWDAAPTVVFCTPDEGLRYGFVTTRGGDAPGITAFNEAGLTLTMHTCIHRDVAFRGRGVVDLGHEIVRRARRLEEALAIVRREPILSTWNIAISSAEERSAIVIGTSGRETEVTRPAAGESHLACTNHYLGPQLQARELAASPVWAHHSRARHRRLSEGMRAGGVDVDMLAALLADHRDPESDGRERLCGSVVANAYTVQSIVNDPERSRIQLGHGEVPTSWGPFLTVDWSWGADVGHEVVRPTEAARIPGGLQAPGLRQAYAAFVEASQADFLSRPPVEVAGHLDRARASAPHDPGLNFLAGAYAAHLGKPDEGLERFETCLAHETSPFRRGQALLWASRAADAAGQSEKASGLRRALAEVAHPLVGFYKAAAAKDEGKRWTKKRFRGVALNFLMVDLH